MKKVGGGIGKKVEGGQMKLDVEAVTDLIVC